MKKKDAYIFAVAIFIIALIVIVVFSFHSSSEINGELPVTKKVVLAKVGYKQIPQTLTAVGKIIAPKTILLSAQQAGVIQALYFRPGESVKKGQLLLQINDATQKAVYAQQLATYRQSKTEYTRYLRMHKRYADSVSSEMLSEKLAAMQVALAQMQSAKVALAQTQVRAPFSGILSATEAGNSLPDSAQTATQLSVGSYLNMADPIAVLTNTGQLLVQYQVSQKYAHALHFGQSVEVTSTAAPGRQFGGAVNYISPLILQMGSVFTIRATLSASASALTPGMTVMVKHVLDPARKILSVPGLSLVPSFAGYTVYTVKNHKIQATPVRIGQRFGPDVAITSGLKLGQDIVVQGQNKVSPGSAVKVVAQ